MAGPSDVAPAGVQPGPLARRPRRLVLALFALATGILCLEGVMQVGAYLVWRRDRQTLPQVRPGQRTVLCVGDSWTHGMGSSDAGRFSYPAQLAELLAAGGPGWTVVNGGQAGQNSRDVLQRLASQLAEFQPLFVCVLVGQNDFWSVPDELPEGAADTIDFRSYRFRWRIPRLVDWVIGRIGGGEAAGLTKASMDGPEWEPRRPRLENPYQQEPQKWKASPEASRRQVEGWRRGDHNDVPGAIAEFEAAMAASPDDPLTRQQLVNLYRKNGRHADAAEQLQWLQQGWQRDGDYWTGRNLALAFDGCGRSEEALGVARTLLEKYPQDALLWRCRAQSEFAIGRHDEAMRSVDESIRLASDPWAHFARYKIQSLGLRDHDGAIRTIYGAYAAFNDAPAATGPLRVIATELGQAHRLRPVLESFVCDPEVKLRLERIVDGVLTSIDGAGARRVLDAHLARIATAVRNAGATPVFLTYPVQMPAEETLRQSAAALGVAFLDVRKRFHELLGGRTWSDVKAPDGHCNDAGYRLMAQAVAEGLQPLLPR